MHIKEIELRNFKSFGRRALVQLKKDFIVITGPNGSGKSNIIDALLFSLCLTSSRAMRAERLTDLIYRGDDGKAPDFAEVTVRLDNSTRAMPVDSDEVVITRRIKVNGDRYHAQHYLNGKPCTQAELQEYLARAGITPEGYNVVMQGDVTRIIEMGPTERRRIIDEIAGVAEFEEKKQRAMEELDVVRERIARVDVILEEVGQQLRRLQAERDRALRYRACREERKRQEAYLLLARLKESEAELSGLDGEIASITSEKSRLLEILEDRREELRALEERLKAVEGEISHKGEDEQLSLRREIEEIRGEIAREETRIEAADADIKEAERSLSQCFIEMDKVRTEIAAISEQLSDKAVRRAGLQGELEEQRSRLSSLRSTISDADSRFARYREELARVLKEIEEIRSQIGERVRERDRLLDAIRRASMEKEEIATEITEALSSISAASTESERLEAEVESLASEAMALDKRKDELEARRLSLRRELAELDRSLQRLQSEYARVEAQVRAAEERSGYSRAVEAVRSAMKRGILQGLCGTIADLGEVDRRYAAALEVAAGSRLQSVVAESDDDAAAAIDYLKRSQIGRATFLPLNKMEFGSLPEVPRAPGVIDFALNLIRFDDRFYPAFWYVFRDTLVVEDLDTARRMIGRYRMVTLDGDLIERSGAMTGGHYTSRLKFAAEESRRLVGISERISATETSRSELLEKLDSTEEEISSISKKLETLDKEISRRTFLLEERRSLRGRMERYIEERKSRLSEIEKGGEEHRSRLTALEREVQELESLLSEKDEAREKLEREMQGSRIPEMMERAEQIEGEIRRLESRIMDLDSEIMRSRLREESLRSRLDELARTRELMELKKNDAVTRRGSALSSIEELKGALDELLRRERDLDLELSGLKGERGSLLESIIGKEREIGGMERNIERLDARLLAVSGARDEISRSMEALRSEIEGAGIDLSEAPPKSETIAAKIRALEEEMAALEPVNMLAIDEYDRVDKRFRNLSDRREVLHREREGIMEKLEQYDRMKKDAFMSCFAAVNQNFREIFHELSGGDGELVLECPDDPLSGGMTIRARPAGKAFHRLEAMSGGEKSLTALSLIFAIQRFRPAPFYAMDEIDMFLDGANVERVAKMIRRISRDAQFIVVSLRRPMIQQASYTIGVSMQDKNISSVTGICLS
ncbi:MAG: chromosome segregation protein SMC [Methanothrix sp.]